MKELNRKLSKEEQLDWIKKSRGILKTGGKLKEEIKQIKKEEFEYDERKLKLTK